MGEALKSEISGTSATYNAVTFHRGAAVASDALEQAPRGAIRILKRLFYEAESDDSRLQVLQTLSRAMQLPLRGVNDALAKILLRDAADIVEFYIEIAPRQSYELLEHMEHVLLWQNRHKGISSRGEQASRNFGHFGMVLRGAATLRNCACHALKLGAVNCSVSSRRVRDVADTGLTVQELGSLRRVGVKG